MHKPDLKAIEEAALSGGNSYNKDSACIQLTFKRNISSLADILMEQADAPLFIAHNK